LAGALTRAGLEEKHPPKADSERDKRTKGVRSDLREWKAYKLWLTALGVFALADFAGFVDVQTSCF
jgi:hypothetical protein